MLHQFFLHVLVISQFLVNLSLQYDVSKYYGCIQNIICQYFFRLYLKFLSLFYHLNHIRYIARNCKYIWCLFTIHNVLTLGHDPSETVSLTQTNVENICCEKSVKLMKIIANSTAVILLEIAQAMDHFQLVQGCVASVVLELLSGLWIKNIHQKFDDLFWFGCWRKFAFCGLSILVFLLISIITCPIYTEYPTLLYKTE